MGIRLNNKIFSQLLDNLKEIKEKKWTSVAMDYREEFITLANSFGVYPCGGAFLDDCSAQVFYI